MIDELSLVVSRSPRFEKIISARNSKWLCLACKTSGFIECRGVKSRFFFHDEPVKKIQFIKKPPQKYLYSIDEEDLLLAVYVSLTKLLDLNEGISLREFTSPDWEVTLSLTGRELFFFDDLETSVLDLWTGTRMISKSISGLTSFLTAYDETPELACYSETEEEVKIFFLVIRKKDVFLRELEFHLKFQVEKKLFSSTENIRHFDFDGRSFLLGIGKRTEIFLYDSRSFCRMKNHLLDLKSDYLAIKLLNPLGFTFRLVVVFSSGLEIRANSEIKERIDFTINSISRLTREELEISDFQSCRVYKFHNFENIEVFEFSAKTEKKPDLVWKIENNLLPLFLRVHRTGFELEDPNRDFLRHFHRTREIFSYLPVSPYLATCELSQDYEICLYSYVFEKDEVTKIDRFSLDFDFRSLELKEVESDKILFSGLTESQIWIFSFDSKLQLLGRLSRLSNSEIFFFPDRVQIDELVFRHLPEHSSYIFWKNQKKRKKKEKLHEIPLSSLRHESLLKFLTNSDERFSLLLKSKKTYCLMTEVWFSSISADVRLLCCLHEAFSKHPEYQKKGVRVLYEKLRPRQENENFLLLLVEQVGLETNSANEVFRYLLRELQKNQKIGKSLVETLSQRLTERFLCPNNLQTYLSTLNSREQTLYLASSVCLGISLVDSPELVRERESLAKSLLEIIYTKPYRLQKSAAEIFAFNFKMLTNFFSPKNSKTDKSLEPTHELNFDALTSRTYDGWLDFFSLLFSVYSDLLHQNSSALPAVRSSICHYANHDPRFFLILVKRSCRLDTGFTRMCNLLDLTLFWISEIGSQAAGLAVAICDLVLTCLDPRQPQIRNCLLSRCSSLLLLSCSLFPLLDFSETRQRLICYGRLPEFGNAIAIYDLRTASPWRILKTKKPVSALKMSKSGNLLAVYSSVDCTIMVRNLRLTAASQFSRFLRGFSGESLIKEIELPKIDSTLSKISFTWHGDESLELCRENGNISRHFLG